MEMFVSLSASSTQPLSKADIAEIKDTLASKGVEGARASKGSVTFTFKGGKVIIGGGPDGTYVVDKGDARLSGSQSFDSLPSALDFALGIKSKSKKSSKSELFQELVPMLTAKGMKNIETAPSGKTQRAMYCSKGDLSFTILQGVPGSKYVVYAFNADADIEDNDFHCSSVQKVSDALDIFLMNTVYLDPGVYFAEEGTMFKAEGDPSKLLANLSGTKTVYQLKPEEGPGFLFTKKPVSVDHEGEDLTLGVILDVKKPGKILIVLED